MNLCQLTNEQQRQVINVQMKGNIFFDHLLSLGEVRKTLDNAYKKVSPPRRAMTSRPSTFHTHIHVHAHAHVHVHAHVHTGVRHGAQ